jgi:hypothetical protein
MNVANQGVMAAAEAAKRRAEAEISTSIIFGRFAPLSEMRVPRGRRSARFAARVSPGLEPAASDQRERDVRKAG